MSETPGPPSGIAAPDLPSLDWRTQLKRTFLRALIASLVTCATIAILVLLLGEFGPTTGRILGTLAALAVHSGIAMRKERKPAGA